jgi:integrase
VTRRNQLPPHVYRQITRHGRAVYYFRRKRHGCRLRLPDYGTPEFHAAYLAALNSEPPATKDKRAQHGSLEWLIRQYRETTAYLALSPATRKQRDNIFKHVIDNAGHVAIGAVTRRKIIDGREDRASTPAQARNFLDAMRGLFRWALESEHVSDDPTLGVKNPKRPKGGGFAPWTEAELVTYEARWPAGTKERVWLHVLLYTGLRRGDAVKIGRQHVRDGIATLRTEKTGTELNLRILPPLAETLAIGPTGDLSFICGESRKPLTKESFGNMFRAACNAAGVRKSAHGLRKIAAGRAADAGATTKELEAWFGWNGGAMAELYTKQADRKRLAASAAEKIGNRMPLTLMANAPHLKKEVG